MWYQKPPLGTPLAWENPLNKGLVMALPMNEGHGDHLNDLSMYGNHGTLKNMAFPSTVASGWNPGRAGVGINFDGVDDYVDCGHNTSLDITTAATFSVWLYWIDNATSPDILAKMNGTFEPYRYSLNRTNMRIEPQISSDAVTRDWIHSDNNVLSFNHWQNVVWVMDGVNHYFYVNGIPAGTDTSAITPLRITTSALIVGARKVGSNLVNGSIDQVRILNRAYTAKEVMDYAMNPWQVYLDEDD